MRATVVITLFNDIRVLRTLGSLQWQTRKPDAILVADGGSNEVFIQQLRDYITKNELRTVELKVLPGRCIDTRRQVITYIMDSTDVIVFIDADEWAQADWLEKLLQPIEGGRADFTGGCLLPCPAHSNPERILNIIQFESQGILESDISYLAMGNSAWCVKVFDVIGNFDDSSVSTETDKDYSRGEVSGSYHVSDDYDINIRALQMGFKGIYVGDAMVWHDQSHVNTFRKLVKYFYSQFVRTSMAYFKHQVTFSKFTKGTTKSSIAHPFQFFLFLLKPIAYAHGWVEWYKCIKKSKECLMR